MARKEVLKKKDSTGRYYKVYPYTVSDAVLDSSGEGTLASRIDNLDSEKYEKPSTGIPESDLASDVQTSLGKADSAVQPESGKGLFSGDYNDLTNKPILWNENGTGVQEGVGSTASGYYSHAEGESTKATEEAAHAEGYQTTSSGMASHAEGSNTKAEGPYSHAEGTNTQANFFNSHAEGSETRAKGDSAHAEGYSTFASGDHSHTEGSNTTANNEAEHAEGKYNKSTEGKTIHSVGIGTSSTRKNAEEIDSDGKRFLMGVGGYDGTNYGEDGVQDEASYLASLAANIGSLSDLKTTTKTSAVVAINEVVDSIGDVETILSTING